MSSSSSLTNVPALIGAFTAVGILAVGAYYVPRILEARAQTQQRRNPLTTQTSPNRRPHRPSRHGVPSLSLTDIELNTIPVIHITRPQMDTAHQDNRAETVGQEIKEEAVWEMGKAV